MGGWATRQTHLWRETGIVVKISRVYGCILRLYEHCGLMTHVSEWGFGIGYIIKNDGLQFCISSGHRQTGRFVHTLKTYLHDVVQIMGIESHMHCIVSFH